ncbi:MAG: rhomboid family intramembrane serine protease, partial [Lachnospiraceae bacterium]|nr:rhomboid family intramembrane serine protease [Lachnospiraceae bacterium]
MNRIKNWVRRNAIAIGLVILLSIIFFASQRVENIFLYYGTTDIEYLGGEYYHFFTCLFLHYNLGHLLANSVALLSVSSLLTPFLKKRQMGLLL